MWNDSVGTGGRGWIWPPDIARSIAIGDAGLTLGLGTTLAHIDLDQPKIDIDRERALALLSVVAGRPIGTEALRPVESSLRHWQTGNRALASLSLIFSGLPRLQEPSDAYRLCLAEYLLDQGMSPATLMKELGFATDTPRSARLVTKYSPDQPRVPAGHSVESGRWTNASGGEGLLPPITLGVISNVPVHGIEIAANGDLKPGSEVIVPLPENPLDPKELNRLLSPQEEQAIADTLNIIGGGTDAEIKALQPHSYRNLPHYATGAVLPPSVGGYMAYSLAGSGRGSARGSPRVVVDQGTGAAYYTNTHYMSFYPIVLVPKK